MPVQPPVIDMTPWIRVVGALIGWTFFLIVLGMIKNFIVHAFSITVADFLVNTATDDQRVKITRWITKGDLVLEEVRNLAKHKGEVSK